MGMRKLMRSVAKRNMKQAGYQNLNRRPIVQDEHGALNHDESKFKKHWREYIQ